jgi:hypothetical protein
MVALSMKENTSRLQTLQLLYTICKVWWWSLWLAKRVLEGTNRVPTHRIATKRGAPLNKDCYYLLFSLDHPQSKKTQQENMETPENVETLFQIYFTRFAALAIFGPMLLGLGGVLLSLAYRSVKWIITAENIFDEYR